MKSELSASYIIGSIVSSVGLLVEFLGLVETGINGFSGYRFGYPIEWIGFILLIIGVALLIVAYRRKKR